MGIVAGRLIAARVFCLLGLLCATAILVITPASAQTALVPPNPSQVDERGVDVLSGRLVSQVTDVAIGPADHHGVQFGRQLGQFGGWYTAQVPVITGSAANPIVSFNGKSVPFQTVSGAYVPNFPDGSTLNAARTLFTAADGTQIEFVQGRTNVSLPLQGNGGFGTKITYPDGVIWTFHYREFTHGIFVEWCQCYEVYEMSVLNSITTSTGYQIKLEYVADPYSVSGKLVKATAINNAVEYCAPVGTCVLTNSWPQAAYSGTDTVTGPDGGTTSYTYTLGRLTGVQPPGASAPAVTYAYDSSLRVSSVAEAGVGTFTYTYGTNTTTVTDPLLQPVTTNFTSASLVTSIVAGGKTTGYSWCAGTTGCPKDLLQTITLPEGNKLTYTYDARGNVTSATQIAKTGTGLANIVISAAYPATCTNTKTCNKPTSTADARGKVTDYRYDSATGYVTSVTLPAPTGTARPKTTYSYAAWQAYYKNSAGSVVASGLPITLPTLVSACRTMGVTSPDAALPCLGGTDEGRTAISYGPQVVGTPNNLNPNKVATYLGDTSLAATTTLTYDNYGRPLTSDGPLSGTADLTRVRYNAAGQVIGQVGPDPDDTGAAKFPAERYSYNARGQLYLTETGTVNSQSDADWAAFSPTGNTLMEFDTYGRPVRQKVRNGTSDYQVVDTVYGTGGRVSCTIVRMTPASWGTVASSCTPPQAGDRVTFNTYDALGRVSMVTSGYGTTAAADDQTLTFTNNGQLATVKDAESNLTTYEYDGHDRLVKTRFPSPTKGANASSATDFEQLTYDSNGNVLTFRTRRNETLTMTYDNLNRLLTKVVPARSGLDAAHTRDVFFAYDLTGNMTDARFDSLTGPGIANAFNALGQLTSSISNLDGTSRTVSYGYDLAGSIIGLTHPDGKYFEYKRYGTGTFSYVSYDGHYLFRQAYDPAGRPSQIFRLDTTNTTWNSPTTFGYDAVSRLASVAHDFAGTSEDVTTSFTHNPASQIASQTRSNDLYAWSDGDNVNRDYAANGLNQYTTVWGWAYAYDANGNLTSDGNQTFAYDVENRLVSRSGGGTTATLKYDPLGRLYEVTGSVTGTTRFLYDGSDLIAEYDASGTMLRRYVHGPGSGDDPLVWFESASVAHGARRDLYADERGSIVAVTNATGAVLNLNTYDEYGIPGSDNAGRFQYTGQAWIPELGMYYYKARMYSPTLGRFMQTDPIGYGDGMNMYAYVRNDPANKVDPKGLDFIWTCVGIDPGVDPKGGNGVGGGTGPVDVCGWSWDGNPTWEPGQAWAFMDNLIHRNDAILDPERGAYVPQKDDRQDVDWACVGSALWSKEGAALGLDAIGVGVGIFFPQATLAQLSVAGASLVMSAVTSDRDDPTGSIRGISISAASFLHTGGAVQANLSEAGSAVARNWGRIGAAGAAVSAYYDAKAVAANYSDCTKGK